MRTIPVLALLAIFTAGCVGMRVDALKERCEPLVGQPEEQLVMQLGAPTQVMHLRTVDVYRYYYPRGTYAKRGHDFAGNTVVHARDSYDQIDFVVRDGKVEGYQVAAQ